MQRETDNYSEDDGNHLVVDDDVNGDCDDNFDDERCIDDSIQLELETVEIAFTASASNPNEKPFYPSAYINQSVVVVD